MAIAIGLDSIPPRPPCSTRVAWGVFDGVHLGHRAVIDAAVAWARRDGCASVVLTFDPHPQAFLRGVRVPLVLPVAERARCLRACGVDEVVVARFDRSLAELPPEAFVLDVLLGRLGAGGVVAGYDSTFGRGGKGTADLLLRLAEGRGVEIRTPAPRVLDGAPVKSTRLRDAIERGDFAAAAAMMGRPPALAGPVVRGDARGRMIGVPTANVDCAGLVLPPAGVYAVRAELDGARRDGVMNIGRRPTFGAAAEPRVEVHLLDFSDADLYGRTLRVEIAARLREERMFPDAGALRTQIGADIAGARRILEGRDSARGA